MNLILYFLLATTSLLIGSKNQKVAPFSDEEKKLFAEINLYRKSNGLPAILFSPKLTKVAQIHAHDLMTFPPAGDCNMHSWSGKTEGKACCYTSNHKNPECMWLKPNELADYSEKGYEIAAMNTILNPDWLSQWKKSKGHNEVIVNQGIWKNLEWKAMGLAIRPPYAVVWFGTLED
jgi:uncharacterized protein YkwD